MPELTKITYIILLDRFKYIKQFVYNRVGNKIKHFSRKDREYNYLKVLVLNSTYAKQS
jgi:hypothetical protein